jgi:hypothetical protein
VAGLDRALRPQDQSEADCNAEQFPGGNLHPTTRPSRFIAGLTSTKKALFVQVKSEQPGNGAAEQTEGKWHSTVRSGVRYNSVQLRERKNGAVPRVRGCLKRGLVQWYGKSLRYWGNP